MLLTILTTDWTKGNKTFLLPKQQYAKKYISPLRTTNSGPNNLFFTLLCDEKIGHSESGVDKMSLIMSGRSKSDFMEGLYL